MAGKRSILGVYAHPDDEQGVSGLMHKYAREGVEVNLICATRGEAGEIAPGVDATPETLGQVRENELRCAAEKIGVRNVYFFDYRDSGMMGTPENNDARCLWRANLFEVTGRVVRVIRRHKPQILLTFDAQGGYGHPDHIMMHQAALMAYFVAGDPRAYPEQLGDGLGAWSVSKLYWTAFARSRFERYAQMAQVRGIDLSVPLKEFLKRAQPDEVITTRIAVPDAVDLKLDALYCHASQMNPNSFWSKIPAEIRKEGLKVETLVRAESRVVVPNGVVEEDLFEEIE